MYQAKPSQAKPKVAKDALLCFKAGVFYNCYGKDAIIINYLFGYKIIKNNQCGFPINTLIKVINKLEEKKINYQIITKDANPIIKDYGKRNNYNIVLSKAVDYTNFKNKVEWLKTKIDDIQDINKLNKILELLENEPK